MATSPCQDLVDQLAAAVDALADFDQETSDWLEIRNNQRAGLLAIEYGIYYQLMLCQQANPSPPGLLSPMRSEGASLNSQIPKDLTTLTPSQAKGFFDHVRKVRKTGVQSNK